MYYLEDYEDGYSFVEMWHWTAGNILKVMDHISEGFDLLIMKQLDDLNKKV